MFENPLGIPDTLPSGYGYADAQPASVRLNASTSRGATTAVRNPANPTLNNPAAALMNAHQMPSQTAVVRLSDIERDEDEAPKVISYAPRAARPQPQQTNYGAAKKSTGKKVNVQDALSKAAGVLSAAGKTAQTISDLQSGKSAKFQDSGAASAPATPDTPVENVGSIPSFWQKKYVGIPTWGWATIAGVVVAGGGVMWYRASKNKQAAAPAAPAQAPKASEKKEAAPEVEAPLVPVSSDV